MSENSAKRPAISILDEGDSNISGLVSQLLQSFVVSYMVMLCVRLALFPNVGLGPESPLLLVTLLVLLIQPVEV